MGISYKRLGSADVALLHELLEVFAVAFNEPGEYRGAVPTEAYLRALLGKPHVVVLTAQAEGKVVGGIVAYVLEKFERARSEVYLYDLAVAEPFRRRGIARQLIQTLKRTAKELGAYVLFVQADPPDEPAIRLYESLGTREDVHHFDIAVE